MAALNNQVAASDVVTALDVEFAANFDHNVNQLTEVLGLFGVETAKAGQAMYQYVVSGSLSEAEVAEGDEVPLSHYEVEKTPIGEMETHPFRKLTTAQAILKGGFRNAVARTDEQMAKDMRALVLTDFYKSLRAGTLRSQGETVQAALAYASADLADELESHNDSAERVVHFMNRQDVAGYLANAQVTTQTMFGMDYLENFLGVRDVLLSNRVERGYIYATPAQNIHLYRCDFSALSEGGLEYRLSDSGVVGVHHAPAYNRTSCETYAMLGFSMLAEVKNYLVRARIGKALADLTVEELKALAAVEGVDVTGKTAKDDLKAALDAAGVR